MFLDYYYYYYHYYHYYFGTHSGMPLVAVLSSVGLRRFPGTPPDRFFFFLVRLFFPNSSPTPSPTPSTTTALEEMLASTERPAALDMSLDDVIERRQKKTTAPGDLGNASSS